MLRHHDISDHHKLVALARLFQNRKKPVSDPCRTKQRQSPVTRASDKVQVMSAVSAMQAAGHDKSHGNRQHRTRPCKKRKSGAPFVPEREREGETKGSGTRPLCLSLICPLAGAPVRAKPQGANLGQRAWANWLITRNVHIRSGNLLLELREWRGRPWKQRNYLSYISRSLIPGASRLIPIGSGVRILQHLKLWHWALAGNY